MNLALVLIVILIVLAVGGAPGLTGHPYGYWPSGAAGLILLIVVILLLTGRL